MANKINDNTSSQFFECNRSYYLLKGFCLYIFWLSWQSVCYSCCMHIMSNISYVWYAYVIITCTCIICSGIDAHARIKYACNKL